MSNHKKRDIADFFRPYQRATVPQKRSTPEPDFDELEGAPTTSSARPRTPPSSRTYAKDTPSRRVASRPLTTPRNDRTVHIPIRDSPQAKTTIQGIATPQTIKAQSASAIAPASPVLAFRDSPSANHKSVLDSKPTVIRDSDDEDNGSLESLADLIGRKKDFKASFAPEEATAEQREVERTQLLSKWTGGRSAPIVGKDKLRRLLQPDTGATLNLKRFLDDDLLDDRAQARIAEAEEEIRASTLELETSRQAEVDRKLLAKVVRDGLSEDADPDTTARLLNAVDRTEALLGDKNFSFFGLTGVNDRPLKQASEHNFPSSQMSGSTWDAEDIDGRDRAYLSGFMTDRAERGLLSSALLRWTFEAALSEPQKHLRHAYISVIANDSSGWVHANVTPDDLQLIFTHLGAESDAIRDSSAIRATSLSRIQPLKRDAVFLVSTLELLIEVCPGFDFATLSKLCSVLCRLVLDSEVMSQVQLSSLLEALLTKLTDLEEPELRRHVYDRIAYDLTTNLEDPILQAKFLSHLIPASAHAAKLRTDLAMTFLLAAKSTAKQKSSDKPDQSSMTNPLKRLRQHISRSSVFSATQSSSIPVNYAVMSASIAILDAAIADGHPDSFVLATSAQQANARDQEHITKPSVFTNKLVEKEFNAAVDDLADRLHELFANIVDSGASHMRRTEAKDALQALQYRLLFAVRTKPRKRKHVFDFEKGDGRADAGMNTQKVRWRDVEEVEGQERGKDFMQRFLKNRDVAKVST